MAFLNRVGNVLKQAVSKHASSQFPASSSSLFQSIRSMSSSSKLFVGGLSYSTDEMSLKEAFSQYGEVVEARVILDRDTGRSRGFGFITFTSTEAASSAIQALDGQDLHGRNVRVNFATERPRAGGFGGGYGSGGGGYGGGGGGYGGGYGNSGGSGGYGGGSNYGGQGGNYGGYQGGGGNSGGGGYGGSSGVGAAYGGGDSNYSSGQTGFSSSSNFDTTGGVGEGQTGFSSSSNFDTTGGVGEGQTGFSSASNFDTTGGVGGSQEAAVDFAEEPNDYANKKN